MKEKLLDFIEGSFALLAIFSIVGVSIITVSALNPVATIDASQSSAQVAGIQTESHNNVLPFVLTDLNNSDSLKTVLTDNLSDIKNQHSYSMTLGPVEKGMYVSNFIKIQNPNNFDDKIVITTTINGQVVNDINVNMVDSVDDLYLYSNNYRAVERVVTVPKLSERTFRIKYEILNTINYPIEVKFTFNQKDLNV